MNKHAKLIKSIPCGNFGASKLFFDTTPELSTPDHIFLAYYHIASEMMDSVDSAHFIVLKNKNFNNTYDCHDPLNGLHMFIEGYKEQKLFSGVIKTHSNRTPRREKYGLVAIPKQNQDIASDLEDFKIFAENYKSEHFRRDIFTNERRYRLGNKQLNHIYNLLKTLTEKADFQYIQPGSIILAQEMASVMINHNIVKNNQNTPYGQEYIQQHKRFMFSELKHDWEHYKTNKIRLEAFAQEKQQKYH